MDRVMFGYRVTIAKVGEPSTPAKMEQVEAAVIRREKPVVQRSANCTRCHNEVQTWRTLATGPVLCVPCATAEDDK